VFVPDVDAPVLDADDRHHLERVLRVRVGDGLTISDGQGRWRPAVLADDGVLDDLGATTSVARPTPAITIGFALVKGGRPELVVQKLTELGVDVVVPFSAERSVVQWESAKAERHHVRLATVARQAAMQSRRCWLLTVEPLASFDEVISRPGSAMADRGGGPPTIAHPTILVGPEGGWGADERAAASRLVDLGDHVLRSETAAIVAGAALTMIRGGLLGESEVRRSAPPSLTTEGGEH
jgi:16S rRNA (uracil1498-N3)-methyltransferase